MKINEKKKLPRGMYWRGKFIWISFPDGSGGQVRESTGSHKITDALAILEKKRTEVREGKQPILKKGRKVRFDDFSKDYLKEREEKKSYAFAQQMIGQINKFFGKYHLDQITLPLVKQYRQQRRNDEAVNRGKKVSPATINREISVLRNALNVAVENERLRFNPLVRQGKALFTKETEKQRIFTNEEISALIAEATLPLRWFIILASNTGMRESEIMGLRWNEIDMAGKVITLTASRTKGNKARAVFMNETVATLLAERKLHRKETGGEYVFPNPSTEKPYRWISHSWAQLLEKCKIKPYGNPPQRPRFHDLRHTWATRAAEAGVPQVDIKDTLGHRYSQTTDRYMSGTDKRKREAVHLVQFEVPAGEIEEMPKVRKHER
jgi:integrase